MKIFKSKYQIVLDNLNNLIRNPNKDSISYLQTTVLQEIKKVSSEQKRKVLMSVRDVAINKLLMEKHK